VSQFNRNEVATNLQQLRNDLRSGKARINWAKKDGFREIVASVFGLKPTDFNTKNFRRSTLDRFARLFAVPKGAALDWRNPTPDETAWALQHFINRRHDVWTFFEVKMVGHATVNADDEAFIKEIEQIMDPGPNNDDPENYMALDTND
jgi:hypothetical protein